MKRSKQQIKGLRQIANGWPRLPEGHGMRATWLSLQKKQLAIIGWESRLTERGKAELTLAMMEGK